MMHVFSAIIWIGGAIFLAIVMVPVARGMEPPAIGLLFLRKAALRFRGIAWVLLGILVVSGVAALEGRGIGLGRFAEDGFWSSEIGTALLVKIVLVGILLVMSGVHDFVLGPRLSDLMQQGSERSTATCFDGHSTYTVDYVGAIELGGRYCGCCYRADVGARGAKLIRL